MPHVPEWKSGLLYKTLVEQFPAFRYTRGDLRMADFQDAMQRSPEAVYKWLRANKITPAVAQRLHALALEPNNLKLLKEAGKPKPKLEIFTRFVFA